MSEYTVRRGFAHNGVYITNDNVDTLPADVAEDRAARGYLARVDVSREHALAATLANLAGVEFASDKAKVLAVAAGLTAAHFDGQEPSGTGGYTAADVRRLTSGQE